MTPNQTRATGCSQQYMFKTGDRVRKRLNKRPIRLDDTSHPELPQGRLCPMDVAGPRKPTLLKDRIPFRWGYRYAGLIDKHRSDIITGFDICVTSR